MKNENEIIKGLKCCGINMGVNERCNNCPYFSVSLCQDELAKDALELIERQEEILNATIAGQESLQKHFAKQKAEAIKEFAARIKATFPPRSSVHCTADDCYTLDRIDELVKEFTKEAAQCK